MWHRRDARRQSQWSKKAAGSAWPQPKAFFDPEGGEHGRARLARATSGWHVPWVIRQHGYSCSSERCSAGEEAALLLPGGYTRRGHTAAARRRLHGGCTAVARTRPLDEQAALRGARRLEVGVHRADDGRADLAKDALLLSRPRTASSRHRVGSFGSAVDWQRREPPLPPGRLTSDLGAEKGGDAPGEGNVESSSADEERREVASELEHALDGGA